MDSDLQKHLIDQTTDDAGESCPPVEHALQPRPVWYRPTVTRIQIKRTSSGSGPITDGANHTSPGV